MKYMTLESLKKALQRIVSSAAFHRGYQLADLNTADMTGHDENGHAIPVMNLGLEIMAQIEALYPGTFTALELEFGAPLALISHDLGRSRQRVRINGKLVDRHEVDGAQMINEMMIAEDIPARYRSLVTYPVVNHRANGVLKRNALDMPNRVVNEELLAHLIMCRRILAILVLADKCIGDAGRVRWNKAIQLLVLRFLGISRHWFERFANEDQRNNFANFAIRHTEVVIDQGDSSSSTDKGSLVLSIQIDERVCSMTQILSVEWFRDAFHCCGKAAQALGFSFRIRTTSVNRGNNYEELWFWSKEVRGWSKRVPIAVPRH
ncbi:hypothetical protein BH10CYA1_BH10CYA1_17990 [soil metagenome]